MFALIVLIVFGVVLILFATQNSQIISINFAGYHLDEVPLYALILASLFLGFAVSWLMNLVGIISSGFKIRGKENTIKNANRQIVDLNKKINQLETDNERLKIKNKKLGGE